MSAATDPLKGLLPARDIAELDRFLAEIESGEMARKIAAQESWERVWQARRQEIRQAEEPDALGPWDD